MSQFRRTAGAVLLAFAVAATLIVSISTSRVKARPSVMDVAAEETQSGARELWEKAVAAKGGRERLRQITHLYVAADQGRGYRQATFYVFPAYRFDFSYEPKRERTGVQVSNAREDIVWWQVDENLAKPLRYEEDDAYLNMLPQFIYLLVTHEIEPVPLRKGKERVGLKRVDVVETEAKGWRVDYYLDSETHLPVKVVLPLGPGARAKGSMNHIIFLEDYLAVDGVMMPRTATHTYSFNSQKLKDRLSFEINPAYDPRVFERPPTPKMGPEAWRPKK